MRLIRFTGSAAMALLLGTLVPAYAQRGQGRQDEKNGKEHARQQQSERRGRPEQQRARGAREQRPQQQRGREARPEWRQEQQARRSEPRRVERDTASWQRQRGWAREGAWRGGRTWQRNRARHWEVEHRTWVQRGGYGGYIIPQARFSMYFGPRHFFRLRARPVIYEGYPRFSYGGFSFLLVDPWPESWAENWYDSDELYIDYNDGYYLCDRRHPGISLAISVVM